MIRLQRKGKRIRIAITEQRDDTVYRAKIVRDQGFQCKTPSTEKSYVCSNCDEICFQNETYF